MPVYVDPIEDYGVKIGRNGPRWCHMTADTPDELHAFAKRLGLKRAWYQDKPRHKHYDLTVNKRAEAVGMGAVELSHADYTARNKAILESGAYAPPKKPYVAPTSIDEFNALCMQNYRMSGFGAEVVTHFPCYGCAAPGFLSASILTTQEDLARGATCSECGRSFRTEYTPTPAGVTQFQIVQTGGPDLPGWMPAIRRMSA